MAAADRVEHGEERLVGDAVGAHPDVARQPPELAHEVDLEASDAGETRGVEAWVDVRPAQRRLATPRRPVAGAQSGAAWRPERAPLNALGDRS